MRASDPRQIKSGNEALLCGLSALQKAACDADLLGKAHYLLVFIGRELAREGGVIFKFFHRCVLAHDADIDIVAEILMQKS